MAETKKIIALNIGSQRVTMALLTSSTSGGLLLKKYETTQILADPAAEMSRLPQVRLAVAELAEKLKVTKETVDYVVSGQSVFTRFVTLPAIDNDNIEQIVTFEAQQHVPFPINEVVWDWQQLGENASQKEVVLVAIKSDALNEINDLVTDAPLTTGTVDTASLALANALEYNYSDDEESILLIDLGARTTNLVYKDGAKLYTRTIAGGGA